MLERLSRFITPDRTASIWTRLAPYAILIFAGMVAFAVGGAGWEYTNSSEFCGTACHIHPPEYTSYLASPHANVNCVECHIGRGTIATQFSRKIFEISHVIRFIGADYEHPIYAKEMRSADQLCGKCHNPEKVSANSLREFDNYDAAKNNAFNSTFLSFNIGGGTSRNGDGNGIHWHIENKVEYIATDDAHFQQEIPWVRVTYADSGKTEVFKDVEANLSENVGEADAEALKTVDCIACHNRIAHKLDSPEAVVDDAMARKIISPDIPYFKQNALAIMERQYPTIDYANVAIRGLRNYYEANWADYYAQNKAEVEQATEYLVSKYQEIVYPSMSGSWATHPNNIGHKDTAGCFRCHDGKHLNEQNEPIPVECNLCHTLPVKSLESGATPQLPLQKSFQPESHTDANWMARHRFDFDSTCEGCHTVSNPGGGDDSSFCANSACHASDWKFIGLDATRVIELSNVLAKSLPTYPEAALTWDALVGPILEARCVACHGENAGLSLASYADAMAGKISGIISGTISGTISGETAGGEGGPAIVVGDAEASPLILVQRQGHPNSLPAAELGWISQWINEGAAER